MEGYEKAMKSLKINQRKSISKWDEKFKLFVPFNPKVSTKLGRELLPYNCKDAFWEQTFFEIDKQELESQISENNSEVSQEES